MRGIETEEESGHFDTWNRCILLYSPIANIFGFVQSQLLTKTTVL